MSRIQFLSIKAQRILQISWLSCPVNEQQFSILFIHIFLDRFLKHHYGWTILLWQGLQYFMTTNTVCIKVYDMRALNVSEQILLRFVIPVDSAEKRNWLDIAYQATIAKTSITILILWLTIMTSKKWFWFETVSKAILIHLLYTVVDWVSSESQLLVIDWVREYNSVSSRQAAALFNSFTVIQLLMPRRYTHNMRSHHYFICTLFF